MDTIFHDNNGNARDRNVERLIVDITSGDYTKDDITLNNLSVYLHSLYGIDVSIPQLTNSATYTDLAVRIFSVFIARKHTDPKDIHKQIFACRNDAWDDRTVYALHQDLSTAILLSIVQDMRYKISARLLPAGNV